MTQLLHLLVTGGADPSGSQETRGQRNIVNATTGEQPADPGHRRLYWTRDLVSSIREWQLGRREGRGEGKQRERGEGRETKNSEPSES